MTVTLPWVLGVALFCAFDIGACSLLLLDARRRRRAWNGRRDLATSAYLPPRARGPTLVLALRAPDRDSAYVAIARLFNWHEARRSQYPINFIPLALMLLLPAALFCVLGKKLVGPAAWLALPLFDVFLTRFVLGWFTARVTAKLLSQFPDALGMVSRSVRIGVPLTEAIRLVAQECLSPTREEFIRAADKVAIGVDMEAALLDLADRNDLPEYRFFATALALQSQTGGGLTETLENLADTIRKREAARKRGHALASEARTSIYVLTALPFVIAGVLSIMNPDYIGVLFTDPKGQTLLAAACFALATGWVVMQQIIKRSLS